MWILLSLAALWCHWQFLKHRKPLPVKTYRMMRCPDCRQAISKAAASCPKCGLVVTAQIKSGVEKSETAFYQKLEAKRKKTLSLYHLGRVGSAVVVAVLLGVGMMGSGSATLAHSSRPMVSRDLSPATVAAPTSAPVVPSIEDSLALRASRDSLRTAFLQQMKDPDVWTASQGMQSFLSAFPNDTARLAIQAKYDSTQALITSMGKWTYDLSEDPMSRATIKMATLKSDNLIELDFPYTGPQHGTLLLRNHSTKGLDILFYVERGQVLCSTYTSCSVGVRFDEENAIRWSGTEPADNSSETVFLNQEARFLSRLKRARSMKISVLFFHQGEQVFEFDVQGFNPARFAAGK